MIQRWSLTFSCSNVEAVVRVSHTFYPRLGLMLRSLVCVARTIPAYQLSRKKEYEMCRRLVISYCGNYNGYHANRFYRGSPDTSELGDGKDNQSLLMHCVNYIIHTGYRTLQVAQCSCSFGTVGISVCYNTSLVLPER